MAVYPEANSPLAKARALVAATPLPEAIIEMGKDDVGDYAVDDARLWYYDGIGSKTLRGDPTSELFASTLHAWIEMDCAKKSEDDIPLGASKYKGLPHLPKNWDWPDGNYFVAQVNCEEAPDVQNVLPGKGILYFFFNPADPDGCIMRYYDGPFAELERRSYPSEDTLPHSKHYLQDFIRDCARLEMSARYGFSFGDEDDVAEALDPDLIAKLDDILGGAIDDGPGDPHMFGKPSWWQGEDEIWPNDEEPDAKVKQLLVFQDEFGEGSIHFWLSPDDLANRRFDEAWLSYSGT